MKENKKNEAKNEDKNESDKEVIIKMVAEFNQDDEENFYYFFNKSKFNYLTLKESYIVFPKVKY